MIIRGNKLLLLNNSLGLLGSFIAIMLFDHTKVISFTSYLIIIVLLGIIINGFTWIKQIEISDKTIIFRRVFWSSKIKTNNISNIKFTKIKLIITRENDIPIKFYSSVINPKDLDLFTEYIKQYSQKGI